LGIDGIIPSLEAEDDRFLELWNLVFMQFNRTQSDPDHSGQWDVPLPAPGVDTGMGLERILSVVNGVEANYETDLFTPIIRKTQELTGHTDAERDANIVPYRVIADHIRAAVFLIADGVLPGAKGRDSVCRLVIRRAARFGAKLGFQQPFLGTIADTVVEIMGVHYTELVERADAIKRVITQEEERFHRTMERGIAELDLMLLEISGNGGRVLPGDKAFYLKATLGLPIQVTKDIVEERGFSVDMAGFAAAEGEHALASGGDRPMGTIEAADLYNGILHDLQQQGKLGGDGVDYTPYAPLAIDDRILALIVDGQPVETAIVGDRVEVVVGATPFYVESGGQVSDTGVIRGGDWAVEIEDVRRPVGGVIVHIGEVVEGNPHVGDPASVEVDADRRADIIRNHTATHLLHAALRSRLGTHVQQRGSLVAPDRLRFDFAHDSKVDTLTLRAIEDEINDIILANYSVEARERSLQEARSEGAMALFGEKYGDRVRTITIESPETTRRYSYELCGGCHVGETAQIGSFIIVSEGSVSAGIRRIEALTGHGAAQYIQRSRMMLDQVAQELGTTPDQIGERVSSLAAELSSAHKQIETLQRKVARQQFEQLVAQVEQLDGVKALIAQIDNTPIETLREMADWFRGSVGEGIVVLGTVLDERPQILVAVSDGLTKQGLHAGNLIKQIAPIMGGGGGGRPTMAQAGGKDAAQLPNALAEARKLIAQR
jgi:alanyl-tRNA synthetase